ncbi:hypothetical protein [Chelatococcus sp. GCM10030263]
MSKTLSARAMMNSGMTLTMPGIMRMVRNWKARNSRFFISQRASA